MRTKVVFAIFFFGFSLDCFSQELQTKNLSFGVEVDRYPPEQLAETVVTFIAAEDMPLHIPLDRDTFLKGDIIDVERGIGPVNIVKPANTIIRPLEKGKAYRIFLIRHPEMDAHYPIGIKPAEGVAK